MIRKGRGMNPRVAGDLFELAMRRVADGSIMLSEVDDFYKRLCRHKDLYKEMLINVDQLMREKR
jgi:hypothetical protein